MNDLQPQTVAAVRALYREDADARQFFEWAAIRKRDVTETSIDRMIQKLRMHRNAAIGLARNLEKAGCGEFVVGRRGSQSRLKWAYSLISLGRVAAGENEDIEEANDPVPEEEEEKADQVSQRSDRHLTIQEAKRLLAESLGLEPSQIVIEIRA